MTHLSAVEEEGPLDVVEGSQLLRLVGAARLLNVKPRTKLMQLRFQELSSICSFLLPFLLQLLSWLSAAQMSGSLQAGQWSVGPGHCSNIAVTAAAVERAITDCMFVHLQHRGESVRWLSRCTLAAHAGDAR